MGDARRQREQERLGNKYLQGGQQQAQQQSDPPASVPRSLPPHLAKATTSNEPQLRQPHPPRPKSKPSNSATANLTPPLCKEAAKFFKDRDYEIDEDGFVVNPCPSECYEATKWPRVVVLSMYEGIGGAFEALKTLPLFFEGWAAESEKVQCSFLASKWPQVQVVDSAETFTPEWLRENVDVGDPAVAAVLLMAAVSATRSREVRGGISLAVDVSVGICQEPLHRTPHGCVFGLSRQHEHVITQLACM